MNLKDLSCILALSPIICVVLGALTLQTFVSLSSTGNKIHSTELFGGDGGCCLPPPPSRETLRDILFVCIPGVSKAFPPGGACTLPCE